MTPAQLIASIVNKVGLYSDAVYIAIIEVTNQKIIIRKIVKTENISYKTSEIYCAF